MKRFITTLLAALLAFSLPLTAFAEEAKGTTLRLADFEGTVTMANASGKVVTPRKDMRLYNGYTTATAKESDAYISLDGTKAVRLGASGKVEICQSGKQLEVLLKAGQLFFNVEAPLDADESLNIRSGTMVTGVRGSFGWVNATEMGLMHGHVTLTCTNPDTGETRVTEVYSGEMVYFEPETQVTEADGELLEIDFVKQTITNDDVPAIVVEEMRESEEMQAMVTADVETVDVPTLLGSLEEKQAEETAAAEEAEAELAEAQAEQDAAIAESESEGADYYYNDAPATTTPTASYDDYGDDGGDYYPSTTAITTDAPDEATLQSLLNSYGSVTLTGGGSYKDITVPAGTTLNIAPGASYANGGTLTNRGTINNYSDSTLHNYGVIDNYGTFNNGDSGVHPGRLINYLSGSINNYGAINNSSDSYLYAYGTMTGAAVNNNGGTVENGTATTLTMNRGLGRYEYYLTGGAGNYYANVTAHPASASDLDVNGDFYAYDPTNYTTLNIEIMPFGSASAFTASDASALTVQWWVDNDNDGTYELENYPNATVTLSGDKLLVTCPKPTSDETLNLTLSLNGTTQRISANIHDPLSGDGGTGGGGSGGEAVPGPSDYYETTDWSTALSALSDANYAEVRYTGSAPVSVNSSLSVNKSLSISAPLTVASGGNIVIGSSSQLNVYGGLTIGEGGSITVNGDLFVSGGTNIATGGNLTVADGNANFSSKVNNAGEITVTGGLLIFHSNVSNGGVITINDSDTTSLLDGVMNIHGASVINSGTISGNGDYRLNENYIGTMYDTGCEWVEATGTISPSNYSRMQFNHDPDATMETVVQPSKLTNASGGTCTLKQYGSGSGSAGANLSWVLDNDVLTISGTGAMENYNVNTVPWSDQWSAIRTVVIESGVTSIGNYAFFNLNNLASATIPTSVTSIGDWAFHSCYSLQSVVIPSSVTAIGESAFAFCNTLQSINIPASVTSIGSDAFIGGRGLETITVDNDNNGYSAENGVLYNKDKTKLLCYPIGKADTNFVVPDSVTSIENYAFFSNYTLTSITIPASVTSIGTNAFRRSALTSVTYNGTTGNWATATVGYGAFLDSRASASAITCNDGSVSIVNGVVTGYNATTGNESVIVNGTAYGFASGVNTTNISNALNYTVDLYLNTSSNIISYAVGGLVDVSGGGGSDSAPPALVGQNGYNITFSIVENFLNATLSGTNGETRAVAYSDESGPWVLHLHVADESTMGLFLVDNLALTSNRYITRVYVYDSSDEGWNSDNPIAGWMLNTPIYTNVGSAAFPLSSVSVTETAPSAGGTNYVYTFTGLDFNNYSYLLKYTPASGSEETGIRLLTPNAGTFNYEAQQSTFDIYAVSTKLISEGTGNAYYLITRTKPITITVNG